MRAGGSVAYDRRMTNEGAQKQSEEQDEPSEWTRLPDRQEERPSGAGRSDVRHTLEEGAGAIAAVVGKGMRRAATMVGAPASSEVEELMDSTDLPEVGPEPDALNALAVRLDREADLWRALALKAVARAAWVDRTAHAAAVIGALGTLALASISGLRALFGGVSWQTAGMVGMGLLALATGATLMGVVGAVIRKGQREIWRDALCRADLTELRLHRVAVVLATRKDAAQGYAEALRRLERETSAPAR